jgi:hypothetical protein
MKSILEYLIRSVDKEPEYYWVGDIIEESHINDIWHYKVVWVGISTIIVDTYNANTKKLFHTNYVVQLPWKAARLRDIASDTYK